MDPLVVSWLPEGVNVSMRVLGRSAMVPEEPGSDCLCGLFCGNRGFDV